MGDIHSFAHIGEGAIIHDPHLSIYLQPHNIRVGAHSRIDGMCKLEGTITIGEFCHVSAFSHIGAGGGEVIFGDHSGCSSHVVICSGMPDLAFPFISAADPPEHLHPLRMRTVIGAHVVIFANATILPGVTIGDFAVIAAGAVVTRDVPAYAIVAGCPARKIRSRGNVLPVDEYTELALARLGGMPV